MDSIALGFAKLNFGKCDEKFVPRSDKAYSAPLNRPTYAYKMSTFSATEIATSGKDSLLYSANEKTTPEEEFEADMSDASTSSSTSRNLQRRKMPVRASKENLLSKSKRRTIMKPTKRISSKSSFSSDFSALSPSEVRKIYLNKKLSNFRPSNLETIFENIDDDDFEESNADVRNHVRLIAKNARKIRRSLSCSNGLNANKTLVKQRRAKIRKTFGRRFALKKISLDYFLERLNQSMEADDEASEKNNTLDSQCEMDEDVTPPAAVALAAAEVAAAADPNNLKTDECTTAAAGAGMQCV